MLLPGPVGWGQRHGDGGGWAGGVPAALTSPLPTVSTPQSGGSDQERTKKKRRGDRYSVQTSLIVATLKKMLPIGLNMCSPTDQELINLAKTRYALVGRGGAGREDGGCNNRLGGLGWGRPGGGSSGPERSKPGLLKVLLGVGGGACQGELLGGRVQG